MLCAIRMHNMCMCNEALSVAYSIISFIQLKNNAFILFFISRLIGVTTFTSPSWYLTCPGQCGNSYCWILRRDCSFKMRSCFLAHYHQNISDYVSVLQDRESLTESWLSPILVIKKKCQTFTRSSFSKVRICCFFLFWFELGLLLII